MGERQIFVRFAGCNLRCDYCDTPGSLTTENSRSMTVEEALSEILLLNGERPHKTVSVTGGEPLLQKTFLAEFLPRLKTLGFRVHLETHGAFPEALKEVVEHCDVVAMDIKLPSSVNEELWGAHTEFLALAGTKAFVKIVLTEKTRAEELERAVRLVRETSPRVPVFFQLATPVRHVRPPELPQALAWWEAAKKILPQVTLSRQMHPVWGLK